MQANILLKNNTLFINGGAPVGIVALDAATGGNPRVVARLEAGMEMFLDPDDQPLCTGPGAVRERMGTHDDLQASSGTRVFPAGRSDRGAGRRPPVLCARSAAARSHCGLDEQGSGDRRKPGGSCCAARCDAGAGGQGHPLGRRRRPTCAAWPSAPTDWSSLHQDSVEGVSADGQSLWSVPLPAAPVRWGVALTGRECVVTLSDGQVVCLAGRRPLLLHADLQASDRQRGELDVST